MTRPVFILAFFALIPPALMAQPADAPHVVFVTGDEEYRSEESMPMLAQILARDYGFRVSVRYALDSLGYVDPNNTQHIPGLDVLQDADLMVLFTRFRVLPDSQLWHILNYAESGKPMVGFRTSTHAFRYPDDDPRAVQLNDTWPTQVFGQRWITHHGHFDDGADPLTSVALIPWKQGHPVLRGVSAFDAYSWLYHVDGGADELYGDAELLLTGTSLRSKHQQNNMLDAYPLTNPVAWTKTYTGRSGQTARVFFTTLGHPYDFKIPAMRTLALNGILWALGREDLIPPTGASPTLAAPYDPNNSGFDQKFKQGLRPE